MWFKQNEQKSPQQPETPAPRPQQTTTPVAPATPQPVETAPAVAPFSAPAPAPAAVTSSRITPGLRLKGEISGREDLWIGGSVDGKLRMESGRVVVGASGKVQGEIEAREVVIEGKVDGNLRAAERLEISSTGTVDGDAAAPRVAVQEGAVFNGSIEVLRAGESRSISQSSGAASRTTVGPRGTRFHTAQAAGVAAAAGAGAAGNASTGTPEIREGDATPAAPAVLRGLAADSSEHSE